MFFINWPHMNYWSSSPSMGVKREKNVVIVSYFLANMKKLRGLM